MSSTHEPSVAVSTNDDAPLLAPPHHYTTPQHFLYITETPPPSGLITPYPDTTTCARHAEHSCNPDRHHRTIFQAPRCTSVTSPFRTPQPQPSIAFLHDAKKNCAERRTKEQATRMFFFFTCGTHTFQSKLAGAENITVQCQNCGNHSGRVMKRWEWFTFCFVPVIPFSLKPYKEVGCHICNFWQDIKYRQDVQQMLYGGGGAPPQQGYMMGGAGGGQNGYGPPPAGVPQYK